MLTRYITFLLTQHEKERLMKTLSLLCLLPLVAFAGNLPELLKLAEQNKQVESSRYQLEAAKENEYATKVGIYLVLVLVPIKPTTNKKICSHPKKARTGAATLSFTAL